MYTNNRPYRGGNNGSYRRNFRQSGRQQFSKYIDPALFINKIEKQSLEQTTDIVEQSTMLFTDFQILDVLKQNIADHGYTQPTSIQEKTIPHILQGRDIIGIAHTGTGKTAAFLISLINKVMIDRMQKVLIVVPTRELALQIADEFRAFAKGTGVRAVTLVGGTSIRSQMYVLRSHPQFVIATPGRLKDLVNRNELQLKYFQNVVLDEVDRMVDIGFINDIKYLISLLPEKRQSLFFSATIDRKTQEIVQSFVANPVTVSVQQRRATEHIYQDIVKVTREKSKVDMLHDLLIQKEFDRVIIFGKTKFGMDRLARELDQRGFRVALIHGNKSQYQRQRALDDFKNARLQVLIATDVASRGIDIKDVSHVINYDIPATYEDYIHRIGRTGRAGKQGVALTFID